MQYWGMELQFQTKEQLDACKALLQEHEKDVKIIQAHMHEDKGEEYGLLTAVSSTREQLSTFIDQHVPDPLLAATYGIQLPKNWLKNNL